MVEGWVPDFALNFVVAEFKRNQYSGLYVVGGPIEQGASLFTQKTYAELSATTLRNKGLASGIVQEVPAPPVEKDRTYASAVALKDWLRVHDIHPANYHVMTIGPHARRSRLLFERALGEGAVVGITAIEDPSYDPHRWWETSVGVRNVIGEFIAYAYVRIFPFDGR